MYPIFPLPACCSHSGHLPPSETGWPPTPSNNAPRDTTTSNPTHHLCEDKIITGVFLLVTWETVLKC